MKLEKKEAAKLRQAHLERLALALAIKKKTTKAGELKGLWVREEQKDTWRKVAIVAKKTRNAKVTKTYYTTLHKDAGGNPKPVCHECNTKASMERAVMKENELRFTCCIEVCAFFGRIYSTGLEHSSMDLQWTGYSKVNYGSLMQNWKKLILTLLIS